MINHLRIDNRLIHGQVAVTWRSAIDAEAIIVCNDKVALDPIQKMALPLAVKGEKVLVLSIADLVKYDQEHPDEKKFAIAKNPSDCLRLQELGVKIETINVGNAAPIGGTPYKMVTKSIAVTPDDAAVYRKIADLNGGHLETQMVPSYDKEDFLALLKKAKL